jgi:hypothetical protein
MKFAVRVPASLLGLGLALAFGALLQGANTFNSVYLSEFLADNQRGLKDDQGDRSPWIELHNGSSRTVNLAGWFLTDSRSNLTKWRFPGVAILPGKELLVFASGKDRTTDLAHLHANFRLKPEGNYLALVNKTTNVISEFAPMRLPPDVSFGRVRGEPGLRGQFTRPTPGRPNASAGPGFAPEVGFSRAAGNFVEPFTVHLGVGSSNATGVIIRYTLDGTLPSSGSPAYCVPLLISNTTHLRARAFQEELLPGPPSSVAYVRLADDVTSFTSTLPVLILDTFGQDAAVNWLQSFVHLSVFEPVNGRSSLTNPPVLATRGGFRVRGSSSAGLPQSGFALELLDEFNNEKPRALCGLPADSDWILYAPNAYDPVLIHNPFVHQLSRDMGRYSPRTRFVEVFVARGGGPLEKAHYNGLYVLEEKIKIGKHRVNIDRPGPEDLKPPQLTGGYILKFDRLGPGENGMAGNGDRGLVHVEPKEHTLLLPQRAPQLEYLQQFFRDFDRTLHGSNWKDPATGYRAYLDVGAAIDFHVLEVLSGNVDAMVLSTYLHKPRGGKIVFGPHWDFDRALGSTDGRDANPRQWDTGPFFGGEWWPRLFSDPDFWQLWVDRWQELRATHFSMTNLSALIDRLAGEVREAQPRQYEKWGFQPRGGSWQGELDLMKSWLSERVDFIDGQLTPMPRLRREGGSENRISMVVPGGSTNTTIYYTLDGSEPRLPQGAISLDALAYTRPVPLHPGVRIVARAHNPRQRQSGGPPVSTPWSGPLKASFETAPKPDPAHP